MSYLRAADTRWDLVKFEHVNTSKYYAIGRLNRVLHRLLEDKSKLRAMVRSAQSKSDRNSVSDDDDASSSNRSLKGDDAVADLMGMYVKKRRGRKAAA